MLPFYGFTNARNSPVFLDFNFVPLPFCFLWLNRFYTIRRRSYVIVPHLNSFACGFWSSLLLVNDLYADLVVAVVVEVGTGVDLEADFLQWLVILLLDADVLEEPSLLARSVLYVAVYLFYGAGKACAILVILGTEVLREM